MAAFIDPLAQPQPRARCEVTRRNPKGDKALTLRLGLQFVNYICVVSFHAPTLFSTTISPGQFHMYAIEAKGLVKQFDGFRAVDGVDLKIPEGSIFGILGPNGAGKTTILRTLLGIIDPDAGTRSLLGSDRPITQSRNVGYLPEERGLYQSMRAVDTIAFMGALRGLDIRPEDVVVGAGAKPFIAYTIASFTTARCFEQKMA